MRGRRSKNKNSSAGSEYAEMTVSELFNIWLAEKKKSISPGTLKPYSLYCKYITSRFEGYKVNDITVEEWQDFEKSLATKKGFRGNTISASTQRQAKEMYRKVFAFGAEEFKLNDPTGSSNTDALFGVNDIELIKKAIQPSDTCSLCVLIALYTGAQASEICGLKWKNIDIKNRSVSFQQKYARERYSENKAHTTAKEQPMRGKNAVRTVPLPSWIVRKLALMKPMHEDDEHLTTGTKDGMEPSIFIYHYRRLLKAAGVRFRVFSATRKTFVKMCIEKGIDIRMISELLGHTNVYITIREFIPESDIEGSRTKLERLYD